MSAFIKNISPKIIIGYLVLLLAIAPINNLFAQDDEDTVSVGAIDYTEEEVKQQSSSIADTPVLRPVPNPIVDSLKSLKVFEYANDPEYWVKEAPRERRSGFWDFIGRLFRNSAFIWFIYILLGSLLLWALYKIIVSNNLFLFSSRNKKLREERIEEEIHLEEATIDERIAHLIAVKDYRAAIRYLYIKVLQQMNEKGWIKYHAQATNYDYIRQISKSNLAPDFRFLTQVYEYVWYGEFEITEGQFSIAHNRFNHFLNRSKPWEEQ